MPVTDEPENEIRPACRRAGAKAGPEKGSRPP